MNYISEGININFDLENFNQNSIYYPKKKNKEFINSDEINYLYLKINKKNKQITELKSKISNLNQIQEKLLNDIKLLQNKNQSDFSNIKNTDSSDLSHEQFLIAKIKKLKNENSKLIIKINKSEEKDNIFYNNINNKLIKAERDLQKLSLENRNNNNIILAIQNFLFNINDKMKKDKQNLNFDLSVVDNNTFIRNLHILESNIINKFNQLNSIGNICLNNRRNSSILNLPDNDINFKRNHHSINNENDKKFHNIKRIFKHRKNAKSINNLNIEKKNKAKMSLGCISSNFLKEENQNNNPIKAYYLTNNCNKEFDTDEDICFKNSINDEKDLNNTKKKSN